jgi:hypothetical protein
MLDLEAIKKRKILIFNTLRFFIAQILRGYSKSPQQ